MKCVGNVPFGKPHKTLGGICLPDFLKESGETRTKLDRMGGDSFICRSFDGGGDRVWSRRIITNQPRLLVILVHRRKTGDADTVPKDFERNALGEDYAKSPLRTF